GEHLLLAPTPGNIRYGYLPSDCSFYWLHFMPIHELTIIDSANPFITETNCIYVPTQGILPTLEKVIILMKQLQDSIRSNYESNFINYITTTILCEIYNQYYSQKALSVKESKRQIYNDITDYIKLTITQHIKVSYIAEHFGYNEKYLSHLFKNIEGLPLKQYILKEKMELAKYRLSDTNDTINEIALSLGFVDSHNFMKAFKKTVGFTPTAYRNAYSKRLLYDK
ncbi:MAG: AraC family transcriptional regulator, partial [Anaerocolumna sp.]|nr:AraC family transcriptional regulator [Anaerocolumna sp.]